MSFVPAEHQPPLDAERLITSDEPSDEAVPLDVLFVGAGPAGLAGALELSRLCEAEGIELEIGVLEKAAALGGHCLSGAVVNPRVFAELFPDVPESELPFRGDVPGDRVYHLTAKHAMRIPTPPTMKNHGNKVASLCEIVRWMGERAEDRGIHVMTGYPAGTLLVDGERVVGVRTVESGLGRDGEPGDDHEPATDVTAQVTVLSEGTRGALTQAWLDWRGISSPNPQIYALGVKELWRTPNPPGAVIHTMGWPLPRDAFGGSFIYPMGDGLTALGLVVGLDAPVSALDVHDLLQRMKSHPLVEPILSGGELVEWGAKTIPEGGFHSLPDRLVGDGLIVVGDAAGFVEVASLKGIHYAMHSGVLAARSIFEAIKNEDTSDSALGTYDDAVRASFIADDLRKRRNMRLGFKSGFVSGGIKAALATVTAGAIPGGKISVESDAAERRTGAASDPIAYDGTTTFSKVDAVGRTDNMTRDDIPVHLDVAENVPEDVGRMYERLCPAGVYEWVDGKLVINAPNCVDCKATDVLGPRWHPREGGSGPNYKMM